MAPEHLVRGEIALNQQHERRLLAVLAHPDDESFGLGGTLALYAQRGVAVHLLCATRGEVGDAPPELLHDCDDIGRLREQELRCAASHLALSDIHFLGYRDSGMLGSPDNCHPNALVGAPLDEVATRVARLIRQIKPQIVITFDPYGGYGHPDHIAIQRATVAAFYAAGDESRLHGDQPPYQPQKLYFHTFPRHFLRMAVFFVRLLGKDPSRWGRNNDIDLIAASSQSFPIHARINIRPVAKAKQLASACHSSQYDPPSSGLLQWLIRLASGAEMFMRAYPPATNRLREHDLFEGVTT
jgi:LmbE family N-acetylglucosaminyl deacetylase